MNFFTLSLKRIGDLWLIISRIPTGNYEHFLYISKEGHIFSGKKNDEFCEVVAKNRTDLSWSLSILTNPEHEHYPKVCELYSNELCPKKDAHLIERIEIIYYGKK